MDGLGQRETQMPQFLGIGRLLVRGDRVMDCGGHALVEQTLLEGGAIGDADDEQVPDVGILAGANGRQAHGGVFDLVTVTQGDCPAMRVIGVEMR